MEISECVRHKGNHKGGRGSTEAAVDESSREGNCVVLMIHQRPMANGQRAAGSGQRAAGSGHGGQGPYSKNVVK